MGKKHKKEISKAPRAAEKTRFPSWLVWSAFSLWGFWVVKNYLSRAAPDLNSLSIMLSPGQYFSGALLSVLPGHAAALAAGLVFLAACAGLGRFLLVNLLKAGPFNAWEEAGFSAALGLAVFAHAVLALAAGGLLYRLPVLALLLVSACLGVFSFRTSPSAPEAALPFKPEFTDFAAITLLAAALLLNLAGALSPEIFYDSLVYHLAVPNFYVIKHGLVDMPYNFYSNFFMLHGMLYSAGLLLKDEMVPKLINYAAGVLSVAVMLGLGRRFFTVRTGLWAALIFYTVTQALLAAWSSGTESLLTLFSLCALAAALRHEPCEKKFLVLSAFFAGCGIAVKSSGLLFAAGTGFVLLYRGRANPGAALRSALLFALVAVLPVLPWLVKNQIYRHNPFFPFLTSVFGVPANADAQKLRNFMNEAREMGALDLKTWQQLPWKITMGDAGSSKQFTPLFLALLPLLFLLRPAAGTAPFWIYFLSGWLFWSFASTIVRYLMPVYPAAALLIAASLEGREHRALRRTLSLAALASCALGLYWGGLNFYFQGQGRWLPVFGRVTKQEYLLNTQHTYSYSHYAAIEFINDKLPAGAKTLIIGDARSFYLKKDFIVSSIFDKTPVAEYAVSSRNGAELYARLRAEGVTHLLLNTAEAIRLGRGYGMFYWDTRAREVFYEFWARHVREVFSRDEYQNGKRINRLVVYEIAEKLPPGTPPAFNVMKEVIMKDIGAK